MERSLVTKLVKHLLKRDAFRFELAKERLETDPERARDGVR